MGKRLRLLLLAAVSTVMRCIGVRMGQWVQTTVAPRRAKTDKAMWPFDSWASRGYTTHRQGNASRLWPVAGDDQDVWAGGKAAFQARGVPGGAGGGGAASVVAGRAAGR